MKDGQGESSERLEALAQDTIFRLACWAGPIEIEPLSGGLTNANYLVTDTGQRYVVRLAKDIPEHNILRWQEAMASRAAHAAGISPEVHHHEAGVLIIRYIDGRALEPRDIRRTDYLTRIVELLHRCHDDMTKHWVGPILAVWPFQVVRSYGLWLAGRDFRLADKWPRFLSLNERLEKIVGPVTVKFGHNDLLAANFLDDGERLWLIDWEYAGLNSELFDLASLSANNELSADGEEHLLETYYNEVSTHERKRQHRALIAAAALREASWSMVQEQISTLDQDYETYTDTYLDRFESALERVGDL